MLTLHIVPYGEIEHLSSVGRIRKLLNLAKQDKIVLLQGTLRHDEEAELIKVTMEEINKDFKGIELAVIDTADRGVTGFAKFRQGLANALVGNRQGLTIIGPANIVKEIRKDPSKIELLTREPSKRRRKKKR